MKKIITICAAILMTASVFAQAPEKMSYQAVIRNSSNALITSMPVGMQISILQGSASGSAVYVETQTPTTNANGLASIEIGGGTVVSGNFSTIDWANGPYFVKTETDPTGGTSYSIIGTSQLLSVTYALHAKTVEIDNIQDGDTTYWKFNNNILSYANNVSIGGPTVNLPLNIIGLDNDGINGSMKITSGTQQMLFDGNEIDMNETAYINFNSGSNTIINGNTGSLGIGLISPQSKLHVFNNSPSWDFNQGNGWGDFKIGNLNHGASFGVVSGGAGAGNLTIWTRSATGTRKIMFGSTDGNSGSIHMTMNPNGNIGIGNINPNSRLSVNGGDVYVESVNSGIILKSPNGNCWRVTVDNSGNFVSTPITCP
jgi:hypothetical protein